MKNISYLGGGKLGDFIYGLSICKYNYEMNGHKAIIYISESGDFFETSLEITFNSLYPILIKQEWCENFKIYNNEKVDINLVKFRQSNFLYNKSFLEIFFNEFLKINPPINFSWITHEKNDYFKNYLIINRSKKYFHNSSTIEYTNIIKKFEKSYFIYFDKSQFEIFPLKEYCIPYQVKDLYEFFTIINSGKLFLGNQTGSTAMASSLNVNRITELDGSINSNFFYNDVKYYNNFKYFLPT
jgi:hypothetical protein